MPAGERVIEMPSQFEVDTIVKGIEISWTTWGKMRDEQLVSGDISYVKSENGRGFERIFAINIEENQEFRVQQMISCIKAKLMPDSMLITPNTKPSNLAEILSHKGFAIDSAAPCMILSLDDYKPLDAGYADFVISDVTDEGQLEDWLHIVSEALFECELITIEQISDVLTLDNTYFYLGSVNGKPVTACMTIVNGDTSVLEMVATLHEYRHRGFASAMIGKALLDLHRKGVNSVSLRAEADGVSVYKKLGFKECFKRVVATCDWEYVYRKACPCRMENETIEKAKQIWDDTGNVKDFVAEMGRQGVIGRKIWYEPQENAIYTTKRYACEFGIHCQTNNTRIGQRCHCEYVNHLTENVPISYCKCSACFYEPLFYPLFGKSIQIEPVQTVLSGAEECVFRIKL